MSFFSNRRQAENVTHEDEAEHADRPSLPQQPVGFDTVLGANSTLEGQFTSKANVRLDGTFSGTLNIDGNVLVGETAKINADIHARNVSIAGAVRGNVSGNKVQLLRTGRIWGDIEARALTTEEGAFIDGKITMLGHAEAPPALPTGESEVGEKIDELAPIIEEAEKRGLQAEDLLREEDMISEGGPTDDPQPDTE